MGAAGRRSPAPVGFGDHVATLRIENSYPPAPSSVRAARRWIGERLASLDLAGPYVDDALLVVSELVSNAIVHGSGEVCVSLVIDGDALVVEVADGGGGEARAREADLDATSGRGLSIVSSLSAAWGQRQHDGGTLVWARLQATG